MSACLLGRNYSRYSTYLKCHLPRKVTTTLKPNYSSGNSSSSCVCDCRYEKVKKCNYHEEQECHTDYKSKCRKIKGPDM